MKPAIMRQKSEDRKFEVRLTCIASPDQPDLTVSFRLACTIYEILFKTCYIFPYILDLWFDLYIFSSDYLGKTIFNFNVWGCLLLTVWRDDPSKQAQRQVAHLRGNGPLEHMQQCFDVCLVLSSLVLLTISFVKFCFNEELPNCVHSSKLFTIDSLKAASNLIRKFRECGQVWGQHC